MLAALGSNAEYAAYQREHGDKAARATALGQAISYRFKRDGKLDFAQNLKKAMDAIALARQHLWLALESFSLSADDLDIQELPVALHHLLADPLGHAA